MNGESIDPETIRILASDNFILKNGGDGFVMFKEGEVIVGEALINYIIDMLGCVAGEDYDGPYGQGRIIIVE